MTELTAERFRECVAYCPETGVLTWKDRPLSHFERTQAWSSYNARCRGRTAGCETGNGYLRVTVDRKSYAAHRLCWLHYYGEWPSQHIDHINGVGTDNRIVNLRDVSNADNHRNTKRCVNNKSGVSGVRFEHRYGTWRASIWRDSKVVHLGAFATKEMAIVARKAAEKALGYHPNHGRAA